MNPTTHFSHTSHSSHPSHRFNAFLSRRIPRAREKAGSHRAVSRTCREKAGTLLTFLTLLTAPGCTAPKPLHGGKATTAPTPTGLHQSINQGDNPSAPTKQTQTTVRTRTWSLPITEPPRAPSLPSLPSVKSGPSTLNPQLSTVLVSDSEQITASTELGAAQKDTARELTAKLSSLKGVVWVGLGLFIFGLATIFWAPLRAIIGSITTSIAITIGGLALMVLPTLIVGNEILILGGVAAVVGVWFLAHRHGHLRGQLATHQALNSPRKSPNQFPGRSGH